MMMCFSSIKADDIEYLIITNTNCLIYEQPVLNSIKTNYQYNGRIGFNYGQLITSYAKTNNEGVDWAYIYKRNTNWNGWIQLVNTYRFDKDKDKGKLFSRFVEKEIFEYSRLSNTSVADVSFTNFNNGYIRIRYSQQDEFAREVTGAFYINSNNNWIRVLNDGSLYKKYYFYKKYLIFLDDERLKLTLVYDSEKIRKTIFYTNDIFYKQVSSLNPYKKYLNPPYKYNDSYCEFDTNNLLLYCYTRKEVTKPYIEDIYQFDELTGKFSVLTDKRNVVKLKNYFSITGDNVRVRAEPATNGQVLTSLNKGAKVEVLKRGEQEEAIGGKKGRWAFVDTGVVDKKTGETIKGWVFDAYLKEEK